jgi:predicted RNase H-like HicB family nuclease
MYVGYVPGFRGAHSQALTIDELKKNLINVIKMLLEDGTPIFDSVFIETHDLILT